MADAQGHTREGVSPRPRRMTCEVCDAEFGCTLDGPCWCSDEAFRLPLPTPDAAADAPKDCLCPACLRARAARLGESMRNRVARDP